MSQAKAITKLEKQCQEQSQKAEKLVVEATVFRSLGGSLEGKLAILDKAVKVFPECHTAYIAKGAALYLKAKSERKLDQKEGLEAKSLIEKGFTINPNSPYAYYTKWKMDNQGASESETLKAMSQVLQLQAVTLDDHMAHALAYKTCNNLKAAIAKYKQILEIPEFSKSFEVNASLAQLLDNIKNYAEAAIYYRNAVDIEKTYTTGWTNLGLLLKGLGRNKEAIEACRKAVKMEPDDTDFLHNLATCLSAKEEYKEAIKVAKQILRLDSTNAQAYHCISLDIKNIADRDLKSKPKAYQKELEKALEHSKLALNQEPDNVLYLAGKADILIALGRKLDALETVVHANTSFKHMDDDARAELVSVADFVQTVLGKQAELVADLGIPASKLQEMMDVFEPHSDDSGHLGDSPTGSGHAKLAGEDCNSEYGGDN